MIKFTFSYQLKLLEQLKIYYGIRASGLEFLAFGTIKNLSGETLSCIIRLILHFQSFIFHGSIPKDLPSEVGGANGTCYF